MVNINQEIQNLRVRLCLDCGKCTSVCPINECDPDFNPRLIVQRRLNQDKITLQDESIWQCLSCYLCTERCNYRLEFPEFIRVLREESREEGYQIKCTHGGAIQSLMGIMAKKDLKQNRLNWLSDDIEISNMSDTIFFVGCAPYFDIIFKDFSLNLLEGVKGALKLLNYAQIPFKLLDNERCCGHDLLMQGDRDGFIKLAQANLKEFIQNGVKKVITSCSEGYYTLKVYYPKILGRTDIEVLHLTEVLSDLWEKKKFNPQKIEKKVTYHDDCRLGRCAGIFEEPRIVLEQIAGLKLVEMERNRTNSSCCGSRPWVYCGNVNRRIQEKRLGQAKKTGADVMVTSCPKCRIHLKCVQMIGDQRVPQIEIQDLASIVLQAVEEVK
jgi:Fe-S oxidoreductase